MKTFSAPFLLLTLFSAASIANASVPPKSATLATQSAQSGYTPNAFLENRVAELKEKFSGRQPFNRSEKVSISLEASRNDWLRALYESGLVEASDLTAAITDKLIMAKMIESYIGKDGEKWHPKTIGLKAFLETHKLLDKNKNIVRDRAKILAAIQKEFPTGAVVKPATGMNSEGKSKGFYFKMDKFLDALLADGSDLYQPKDFFEPTKSQLLKGAVASGELLVLQENVITAAGVIKPLKVKELHEVRLHTMENRVVKGATFPRWSELDDAMTKAEMDRVEAFVQEFLDKLPASFLANQAWALDVATMDNGAMRIIEVNVNRGERGQWSGFSSRPGVLGAYTRHIEKYYPVHFAGISGVLFRNNLGNYFKYLRKKYIEKVL